MATSNHLPPLFLSKLPLRQSFAKLSRRRIVYRSADWFQCLFVISFSSLPPSLSKGIIKNQREKRCASEALPQAHGAEFHHGDWLRCRFFFTRSIMRDMAGKIAELKFEAPLARFEEEDTASLKNMNLLTGAREHACRRSFSPFLLDFATHLAASFYRLLLTSLRIESSPRYFPNRRVCPNYEYNSSLSKSRI